MLVDRIYKAVESREDRPPKIGAYNIGKCVRSLWYTERGVRREWRIGRGHLVMDAGRYIEDMILDLMEEAGEAFFVPETVESEAGYRMRPDAILWDRVGGGWVIIEVKTMSNYGFMEAQRGNLDRSYLMQVESYFHAKYEIAKAGRMAGAASLPQGTGWVSPQRGIVLCVRKETLHLHEVPREADADMWKEITMRLAIAKHASQAPQRPYDLETACTLCQGKGTTPKALRKCSRCSGTGLDPDGPLIGNFPCGYCDYKTECWGPLEMKVLKGKPRWKVIQNDIPDAIVA